MMLENVFVVAANGSEIHCFSANIHSFIHKAKAIKKPALNLPKFTLQIGESSYKRCGIKSSPPTDQFISLLDYKKKERLRDTCVFCSFVRNVHDLNERIWCICINEAQSIFHFECYPRACIASTKNSNTSDYYNWHCSNTTIIYTFQ